jgi:hypothetical protein
VTELSPESVPQVAPLTPTVDPVTPTPSPAAQVLRDNNAFITKLAIVGVFILVMLGVLGLGYMGYTKYQEHTAEQLAIKKEADHKAAQAYIREMIIFCDFANLKAEEQATVDKCGDDIEAARFALGAIISDRVVFWKARMMDANERMGKLLNIKRNATYWSVDNEYQFKEVGAKLVSEYETAQKQRDQWQDKAQKLKTFTPKGSSKTLESKPTRKDSGTKA